MTPKTLQNNKTNLPFLFMDVLHSMFQYFFLKKSNNPFQSVSRDFSIINPVSSLITSCYRYRYRLRKKTGYFGERCDINLRYQQRDETTPPHLKILSIIGLGARLLSLVTKGNPHYFGYSVLHV